MKLTKKLNDVKRRDSLQMWAYGKMWCTGARQPSGGKQGDSYDLYAHHSVQSSDGIKALFANARVSSIFSTFAYFLTLRAFLECTNIVRNCQAR